MMNKVWGMSLKSGGAVIGVTTFFIILLREIRKPVKDNLSYLHDTFVYSVMGASLLLVVGAEREEPLLLIPWMVIFIVAYILDLVLFFSFPHGYSMDIWTLILLALILTGIVANAWLGIYSLFKQLKAQKIKAQEKNVAKKIENNSEVD